MNWVCAAQHGTFNNRNGSSTQAGTKHGICTFLLRTKTDRRDGNVGKPHGITQVQAGKFVAIGAPRHGDARNHHDPQDKDGGPQEDGGDAASEARPSQPVKEVVGDHQQDVPGPPNGGCEDENGEKAKRVDEKATTRCLESGVTVALCPKTMLL